jgi:hypothetical protein
MWSVVSIYQSFGAAYVSLTTLDRDVTNVTRVASKV